MLKTTVGQLLLNDILPPDMRRYDRVLDKSGVADLMQEIATKHPEKYRDISKKLMDLGHQASTATGSHSFGLRHLRTTAAAKLARAKLEQSVNKIYADQNLSPEERNKQVIAATQEVQKKLVGDVFEEAKREGSPLGRQVVSGSRGSPTNLNSLIGWDGLYEDHRGNIIPIPVTKNYSQGLSPAQYFAGAFGARTGLIRLKESTADAGFFAKQLVQANHRLLVSKRDHDHPYDESSPRGMPVDIDDAHSLGGYLAHPIGGYKRNTLITPGVLRALKEDGHDQILIRSPTVGGPKDGGVYAYDVGNRDRNRLAPVGDFVGIAGAQAIAEPVVQGQIGAKHGGGIVGASSGAITGFKGLNQLVQTPKIFQGGASHAQIDGSVKEVREAPQGGHYVRIGDQDHYVRHGVPVTVKPGDRVEAGDVLSEGTKNPAEIVKHQGIGEGRRQFTKIFSQMMADSGINHHRRNVELLSRGLINHVRLSEELGDYAPDDVVPYQSIESDWQPRPGYQTVQPKQAIGRYLESPVLHYSIGTPIKPSVVNNLQKFGVNKIAVHPQPPPFQPEMIRGMANITHDPDWMTRLLGSYQQSSLLGAVHRGGVSDEEGSSYVPALARRENFGIKGLTKGWDPKELMP